MQIYELNSYMQQQRSPVQFYIQDLLPKQGSMLLYGETGVMKSFLAQHIALCLATKTDWIGFKVEQARVLLVNFEISELAYFWRLKDMTKYFTVQDQMLYVASPSILMLEDDSVFKKFADDIKGIAPQVLILDCLQKCYGGDENSKQEMLIWILHIEALMKEFGCSVIVVHHTNKNILSNSLLDKSRGTSLLPGWADSVVNMVKQPSGVQLQYGKLRQTTRQLVNTNIMFDNFLWKVR